MTKQLLSSYVAQTLLLGDPAAALEQMDGADALIGALGRGKFIVIEEALKTIVNADLEDGIRIRSVDELGNMIVEYGLRLRLKAIPGPKTLSALLFLIQLRGFGVGSLRKPLTKQLKNI